MVKRNVFFPVSENPNSPTVWQEVPIQDSWPKGTVGENVGNEPIQLRVQLAQSGQGHDSVICHRIVCGPQGPRFPDTFPGLLSPLGGISQLPSAWIG